MSRSYQPHQGGRPGGGGHDTTPVPLDDATAKKILEGDGRTIADFGVKLADALRFLERAQIRNFYGPMIRLKESGDSDEKKLNDLHLMRARLVYMKAREKKAEPLQEVFEKLIRMAAAGDVAHIFQFAEAVVGYHRLHKS